MGYVQLASLVMGAVNGIVVLILLGSLIWDRPMRWDLRDWLIAAPFFLLPTLSSATLLVAWWTR